MRDRGCAEDELAWGRAARRRWPMAGHTPMRRRRWDERAASSRSVAPEVEDACVLALQACGCNRKRLDKVGKVKKKKRENRKKGIMDFLLLLPPGEAVLPNGKKNGFSSLRESAPL